jgi:uncharacterized protein (DUF302 family)
LAKRHLSAGRNRRQNEFKEKGNKKCYFDVSVCNERFDLPLHFSQYLKVQFMNPKGMITKSSPYSVKETIDRLVLFLESHGATIYARIDQQSELMKSGLSIRPIEFLMFGNPKAGGPIMQDNPLAAIDLPLKIIAWEDGQKKVWLGFNDASYIAERFGTPQALIKPLELEPLINHSLA